MDATYLSYLYYGIATLVFLVIVYFAVGIFTFRLEICATMLRVVTLLPIEEILFWPFHVDMRDIWSRRWRGDHAMQKEMVFFPVLLLLFAILYACLIVTLRDDGCVFIASKIASFFKQ